MAGDPQRQAMADGGAPGPLSVSAELETIFLDATGLPSSRAARLAPIRKGRGVSPAAPRRRFPIASLGAVVAAALVGLSTGAVVLRRPAVAEPPRHDPLPIVLNAPAPNPTPAPVATLAAAGDSTTDLAAPKVQHAVAIAPKKKIHASRVTHADLMTADRRLRRAYERAIDAGVPRPVLASYRNRWADLRMDASWRPDRVAVGYAAMAGDLTRLSERRHSRHAPHARAWRGWRNLWR